jgi:uncharacterized protein Yka (UPF0111/DUF47 family)
MNDNDEIEDLESLSEDEQSALEQKVTELEQRVDQLEMEGREGFTALKNQNRLVHYLRELTRRLEEKFGIELPGLPSLEEPGNE